MDKAELLKKLFATALSKPGIYNVRVLHDDWCLMLNGGQECNCNPIIECDEHVKENNREQS